MLKGTIDMRKLVISLERFLEAAIVKLHIISRMGTPSSKPIFSVIQYDLFAELIIIDQSPGVHQLHLSPPQ